ncbi:uncharacterized protein LOC127719995 [Mytilus californianus]|uniref:uncharacterized protein LOC127719995 n=1 Tax=Mytilus californianus TaxID=6549 RepID=UPI002247E37F|nr:uncharacterized protein LOC127719995 [Mytilus californianus]
MTTLSESEQEKRQKTMFINRVLRAIHVKLLTKKGKEILETESSLKNRTASSSSKFDFDECCLDIIDLNDEDTTCLSGGQLVFIDADGEEDTHYFDESPKEVNDKEEKDKTCIS